MAHRVVIVGGGFAGLYAAKGLKRSPVNITVLDRRNFHLFQPLLYQVATGALSPANIASPLRGILRNQPNTQVLLTNVTDIDVANKQVVSDLGCHPYDTLLVCTGAKHTYFGNDAWEKHAPGLKTLEDAVEMRRRILLAFEEAEAHCNDAERVQRCLSFVIVGGGPTGVELAGAVAELAHHTLKKNFRNIKPEHARIFLVENSERILQMYSPKLSLKAQKALEKLGVTLLLNCRVTAIEEHAVTYSCQPSGATETVVTRLPASVVLWGAGVQASSLGKILAQKTGAELDRQGRIKVLSDCTITNHPEILVLGDLAHFTDKQGKPIPGVAPVAIQMGSYAAQLIRKRLDNQASKPFQYFDKGSMATIGRGAAIAQMGKVALSGYLAWLAWLFIHLIYLVGFSNRLLVLIQWAWHYITKNREARLITPGHVDERKVAVDSGRLKV